MTGDVDLRQEMLVFSVWAANLPCWEITKQSKVSRHGYNVTTDERHQ